MVIPTFADYVDLLFTLLRGYPEIGLGKTPDLLES